VCSFQSTARSLRVAREELEMIHEQFETINDNHEFTICDNGFTLRVGGKNSDSDWITKTYVYTTIGELFDGIRELTTITVE